MADFNVYLGNPQHMAYPWQQLVDAVDALILPAVNLTPRYTAVVVRSTMTAPQLQPHELLCYVLPRQFASLAGRRFGVDPSPNHAGQTHDTGSGVLCEVYSGGQDVQQTARCVVHEFLHAKTGMSNTALHALPGLCASPPVGNGVVNAPLMAQHFFRPLRMWTGGF